MEGNTASYSTIDFENGNKNERISFNSTKPFAAGLALGFLCALVVVSLNGNLEAKKRNVMKLKGTTISKVSLENFISELRKESVPFFKTFARRNFYCDISDEHDKVCCVMQVRSLDTTVKGEKWDYNCHPVGNPGDFCCTMHRM